MKTHFKILSVLMLVFFVISCESKPSPTPKFVTLPKDKIIETFRDSGSFPFVLDAAISEKPGEISIVIIVDDGISPKQAKDALNSLMRRVIAFSDDNGKPSKVIGETAYDYIVGAYTSSESEVVLGAKVSGARNITW